MSDEIARWATGTAGIAATRFLFVSGGRIYPDRQRWRRPPPAHAGGPDIALTGVVARRPAVRVHASWGPGGAASWCRSLATRRDTPVPGTQSGLNITPVFSPDGKTLAYAHSDENGTDIFTGEHRRSLLRATLDRRTLCGQFICNVLARRKAHRLRLHPCRTAADLCHGRRRDRSRAPGAVRFRRQRAHRTRPSGPPMARASFSTAKWTRSPQIFLVDVARHGARRVHAPRPAATKTRPGRPTAGTSRSSPTGAGFASSGSSTSKPAACASSDPRRRAAPVVVPPTGPDRGSLPTLERGVMMRASSLLMLLATTAVAAGCGGKKPPEEPAPQPAPAPAPAPTPPPPG